MLEIRLLFGRPKSGMLKGARELCARRHSVIQAMDASMIVSGRHAAFAAEKAMAAFAEGRNVAKDPGIEILRYASGQRQIERALMLGISNTTERAVLVVIGDVPSEELDRLIEQDRGTITFDEDRVRHFFDITDAEIEAAGRDKLPELVIERVALVDAYS